MFLSGVRPLNRKRGVDHSAWQFDLISAVEIRMFLCFSVYSTVTKFSSFGARQGPDALPFMCNQAAIKPQDHGEEEGHVYVRDDSFPVFFPGLG